MTGITGITGVSYGMQRGERQDLKPYFDNTECLEKTGCVKPDSGNVLSVEKGKVVGIRPGGGAPIEIDANRIAYLEPLGGSGSPQTQVYLYDDNGQIVQGVLYMAPVEAVAGAYQKALDIYA